MLAKRIIPCLDVNQGKVVKGVQFQAHKVVGDIIELATRYCDGGADELVFYDISASGENRVADKDWIKQVARSINIPFCVAGGIRNIGQAEAILNAGADKISINSPALETPELINQLVRELGQQCVVIGIDSLKQEEDYFVYQYTGSSTKNKNSGKKTEIWIREVQDRGAGEIVLNCMSNDGVKNGFDLEQLSIMRSITEIPLIASGGAGKIEHFSDVFKQCGVDGALAASVFHNKIIEISELKFYLFKNSIEVRL